MAAVPSRLLGHQRRALLLWGALFLPLLVLKPLRSLHPSHPAQLLVTFSIQPCDSMAAGKGVQRGKCGVQRAPQKEKKTGMLQPGKKNMTIDR